MKQNKEGLEKSPAQGKDSMVEEIVQDRIIQPYYDYLIRNREQWAVSANRASEIGHSCIRYLVLARLKWQERPLPSLDMLLRFREGNNQEQIVLRDLTEAGHRIVEQARGFAWKEYQLSGHIDGKIQLNGDIYPMEIKSATEFSFNSINTVEDMLSHKWGYMRKYPYQLTAYLLMDAKYEKGCFVFKNKSSGKLKTIWVPLDYEMGEVIIKRCEAVNKHIAEETPIHDIPLIDYDEMVCGECDFLHLCLPDVKREALKIDDDPELIEKLVRWDELKASYAEYQALDKDIKGKVKDVEKAVCGDYLITGSLVQRKGFTVEPSEYWKSKIQKLAGGETSDK